MKKRHIQWNNILRLIMWICMVALLVWMIVSFAEVQIHSYDNTFEYNDNNFFQVVERIVHNFLQK